MAGVECQGDQMGSSGQVSVDAQPSQPVVRSATETHTFQNADMATHGQPLPTPDLDVQQEVRRCRINQDGALAVLRLSIIE